MTEQPQDMLERMVSDHLKTTLDPQRGRAADAFRKHLESSAAVKSPPAEAPRELIPRRTLWLWAGVPSALAAGLAVVITLTFMQPTTKRPIDINDVTPAGLAGTISFDQMETSNDMNAGVATLGDNTPVRVIRRQTVRHTQWVDPTDHATYSVTEPVEKVGYLRVQPY